MPNWNEMQKKAIYTTHKNILVSASAGSGKTTVLIARLLHLIKDKKVELNRILAMTFTEAAANEMKKRMAKELISALENANDEEEKNYLQDQLANLSSSYISTIHGFCLNIIQNYYYIIGLRKERIKNIADDSLSATLIHKSMEVTFQTFLTSENFLHLRRIFSGRASSDEALKESILSLFYLANAKSNPLTFLEACQTNKVLSSLQEYDEEIRMYFFDYLNVQVQSIYQSTKHFECFALAEQKEELAADTRRKLQFLESVKKAIETQDYSLFRETFILASQIIFSDIKDFDEMKQLKKQCETFEEKVHALLFKEEDFLRFTNESRASINTLVDVTKTFLLTYTALKEEENCIDFSDMEHFALRILEAENGLVASFYREQFIEIMVDEFQDSNDVQDHLVQLICKENNVFRVGDIKQSIYRFRHATPEIMRSLIENKTDSDEVIYLNSNYRSKKTIVDFNNTLFNILMNVDGFNSSFLESDHTNCGLASQEEDCHPIHFHVLDDKAINQSLPYPKNADELKSSYIANKIVDMVEQGYHYRDFVILIKTNAKSDPLRNAFEQCGIPYYINMKYGFFDSSAVMNVITFLKTLQDPQSDLYFVALLLSPFAKFTEEEVAQAKLHKTKDKSFYAYFKGHEKTEVFDALLSTYKKQKLSDTLQEIFTIHDYYEKYTTAQEKSNLDKLFEMVCKYEEEHFLTLEQLLLIIEQSKGTKIGEAIPIGNEDDVVRVMSIHQSKGLQFPVVFLYSTSNVNLMDTHGIIAYDDKLKTGMNYIELPYRYVYPTIERIALNHKATKATLEEELRVLYVATTRAQNEMYIVDCGKKENRRPLDKVELYQKKGFTSWILQSFQEHKIPSLYEEVYIEDIWEEKSLHISTKKEETLEKYSFAYVENETLSPSDNEVVSYRPSAFSTNEDYAMQRGTSLHKMVEVLPSSLWDLPLLEEYAKTYELTLFPHDYDILLDLSNDEQFKLLQHGKVIHEFPFMIKEKQRIIHGYMDYLSIIDNHVYMIDFKSDKNTTKELLIKRYKGQIDAYTNALKLLYPDYIIQSYIYSFELKEMILLQ